MRNIFCSSWHRKPKLTPHSAVSWRNSVSWTLRFPNFARRCALIPNMLRPTTIWVLRSLSWITADEALVEFREAIRLNPENAEAYNTLGLTLVDQGSVDEAMHEYREVLRIDPQYA